MPLIASVYYLYSEFNLRWAWPKPEAPRKHWGKKNLVILALSTWLVNPTSDSCMNSACDAHRTVFFNAVYTHFFVCLYHPVICSIINIPVSVSLNINKLVA